MWQDWIFGGIQLIFAISLLPSVFHRTHKPAFMTSVFTSAGLYTLALAYASLTLWFAALMAAIIGTLWAILAMQRFRLDRQGEAR
jgi:hypothetical protein